MRIENNENPAVCAACGGKCCSCLPGCSHPQDFSFESKSKDQIREELIIMFKSGDWQIDWWESYETEEGNEGHRGFFIRPATKKGRGPIYHGAWAWEGCVFHSSKGCALPFDERPFDCKELVPKREGCIPEKLGEGEKHPKLIAIEEWWPYEDLIIEAASTLGETERPESDIGGLFGGMFGMFPSV